MQHIDEHTLELYTLGSSETSGKTEEIEMHLEECEGCRRLVLQMREFHNGLVEELNRADSPPEAPGRALSRRRKSVGRHFGEDLQTIFVVSTGPIQRINQFVHRHPLGSATGSFAILAALFGAGFLLTRSGIQDDSPAYTHYNTGEGLFEVYNKEDQRIWALPSPALSEVGAAESRYGVKQSVVADVNGDGKNEVICVMRMSSDKEFATVPLRIFGPNKSLIASVLPVRPIQFRGQPYRQVETLGGITVEDFTQSGAREIITQGTDGRSPEVYLRIDGSGKILGEYWHFGNLAQCHTVDIDGDGKKELVLAGSNDVDDGTGKSFPVMVVLDPTKIVGAGESVMTKGFGLHASESELYYISLPVTDIDMLLKEKPVGRKLSVPHEPGGQETIHLWSAGGSPASPEFEYVFSKDLQVLRVNSADPTVRLHDLMLAEGKIKGKLNESYLDKLRTSVRYWDGTKWSGTPARIKHQKNPM